jgi:hypothetical protein
MKKAFDKLLNQHKNFYNSVSCQKYPIIYQVFLRLMAIHNFKIPQSQNQQSKPVLSNPPEK